MPEIPASGGPGADSGAVPLGTDQPTPDFVLEIVGLQKPQRPDRRLRRHARYPCQVRIRLEIEDAGGGPPASPQVVVVTTRDISAGGFSFFHGEYLRPGTVIRAHFDAARPRPLPGHVRHCKYLAGNWHAVGVEFDRPLGK